MTTTTIPPDLASDRPLGVYEVSVDQVLELLPHLDVADLAPAAPDTDQPVLTVPRIARWILMCTAQVSTRTLAVTRLALSYRTSVTQAGNTIVANLAASYVSAAVHGTGAAFNESSYSEVLARRANDALDALGTLVDSWALPGGGQEDTTGQPTPGTDGAAFISAPEPMIRDGARW